MTQDSATVVRRHFDSSPAAVREARQFLKAMVADRVGDEVTDALALALSELATNAVIHARTEFDVVISLDGQVRIEVEDGTSDLPTPRPGPGLAGGGFGLKLVEQLCDRWGVRMARDRKCVWCERDIPSRKPSLRAVKG